MNITKTAIQVAETDGTTIEQLAGVPEGTEVNGEVIVVDKDDAGNVIGWHKEPKGGK
ncbi:hypothetical protein HGB25_00280 [Candidatus Saccharibacteria bacterium]|nr:hypothetical protein [Candidatus Saccharibacteria bacterium]